MCDRAETEQPIVQRLRAQVRDLEAKLAEVEAKERAYYQRQLASFDLDVRTMARKIAALEGRKDIAEWRAQIERETVERCVAAMFDDPNLYDGERYTLEDAERRIRALLPATEGPGAKVEEPKRCMCRYCCFVRGEPHAPDHSEEILP